MLRLARQNWGPFPFRVLNCWFPDSRFKAIVEASWSSIQVEGWGAFVVKEKLKELKQQLKVWNKEVFGNLNTKRNELVLELNALDKKAEEAPLSVEEVARKKALGG